MAEKQTSAEAFEYKVKTRAMAETNALSSTAPLQLKRLT